MKTKQRIISVLMSICILVGYMPPVLAQTGTTDQIVQQNTETNGLTLEEIVAGEQPADLGPWARPEPVLRNAQQSDARRSIVGELVDAHTELFELSGDWYEARIRLMSSAYEIRDGVFETIDNRLVPIVVTPQAASPSQAGDESSDSETPAATLDEPGEAGSEAEPTTGDDSSLDGDGSAESGSGESASVPETGSEAEESNDSQTGYRNAGNRYELKLLAEQNTLLALEYNGARLTLNNSNQQSAHTVSGNALRLKRS